MINKKVKPPFKIKRDKYFIKKGGLTRILKIRCSKCERVLFLYQKDGPKGGWLKRCYLNRIISPNHFNPQNPLKCCTLIGMPMIHKDGRPAYKLIKGTFKRSYGDQVQK